MDLEDRDNVKGIEELYNIDLMCPFCHESVDIFNNDLQFSIDLHSQNERHKNAYKLFHENNLTDVKKSPDYSQEMLDPAKQNSIIINSILSSMSDGETLNPVVFEDGEEMNDSFCENTFKNLSLNNKNSTTDLKTLFMQLPKGYVYNITLISKDGNQIFCKLCAQVVVKADDDKTLTSELILHLDGSHKQKFLRKVLNLFPKKPVEDEDGFSLYMGVIICKLCCTIIPIAVSGVKSTFYNMFLHVKGRKHGKNLLRFLKDYKELKQLFSNQLPQIIESNKYYLMRHSMDFKCFVCQTIIPVIKPTTQKVLQGFSDHFNSKNHKENVSLYKMENNKDGLCYDGISSYDYVKSKIYPYKSPVIEQNKKYIIKEGRNLKCNLCDIELQISSEPSVTVSVFCEHFKSNYHKKKLKMTNKQNDLSNKPKSSSKPNKELCNEDFNYLEKLLLPFNMPQIITNNKNFLIKQGNNFQCTLCDAQLSVCSGPENTILQFSQHLKGVCHKNNCKKLVKNNTIPNINSSQTKPTSISVKNNSENCKKNETSPTSTKDFDYLIRLLHPSPIPEVLRENRMYLVNEGNHYKCTVCNVQLMVSSDPLITIFTFSQHLNGVIHKKMLLTVTKNLIFNNLMKIINPAYVIPNDMSSSSDDFESLKTLIHPLDVPSILEENKRFLIKDKNHYKCSLCNSVLTLSLKPENTVRQFSQHMKGVIHKENLQAWDSLISQFIQNLPSCTNTPTSKVPACNDKYGYLSSMQRFYPSAFENLIKPNMQFIQFNEDNFLTCSLCAVNISVSPNPQNIISQFSEHANGKQHKSNTLALKNNISGDNVNDTILLLNKELHIFNLKTKLNANLLPDIIERNAQFLISEGNNIRCTLCDAALTVSSDVTKTMFNFSQHLSGNLHSKNKLKHNTDTEVLETSGRNSQVTNVSSKKETGFQSLMKILHPCPIPQIIFENKSHIIKHNNNFKCALCDEVLQVSKIAENSVLNFVFHFLTAEHKNRNKLQRSKIDANAIQQHMTAMQIPKSSMTKQESSHYTQNDRDNQLECSGCSKSINICWSNKEKASAQIIEHFQSESHKKKSVKKCRTNKSAQCNSNNEYNPTAFDILANALSPHPIPKVLENNKQYINIENDYFKCILCNVKLSLSSSPSNTIHQFSQHLNSSNHKRLVKYNKIFTPVEKPVISLDEEIEMKLNKFLHPIPMPKIVKDNAKFLVMDESYLKCTLCTVQFLAMSADPIKWLLNLSQHLESKRHKKGQQNLLAMKNDEKLALSSITDLDSLTDTSIINLVKIPPIVEKNKMYIKRMEEHFQCILCKAQFPISKNISSLIYIMSQHLQSKQHIKKVTNETTSVTITKTTPVSENSQTCDKVLQSLIDVLQINTVPDTFLKNKEYIVKSEDGYQCSLCKVQLCVTQSAPTTITIFNQHLQSTKHLKKVKCITDKLSPELVNKVCPGGIQTNSAVLNKKTETTSVVNEISPSCSNYTNLNKYKKIENHLKDVMYPYGLPKIIEKNMAHLVNSVDGYVCTACNIKMVITQTPYITVLNFVKHLESEYHITNTKSHQ